MVEVRCAVHVYTKLSGNKTTFFDLAQAALDTNVDVVITSDRNVYLRGHDQYYYRSEKKMLLLFGEEFYDPLESQSEHILLAGENIENSAFTRRSSNNEIRILVNPDNERPFYRHIELINATEMLKKGYFAYQKNIRENLAVFENTLNNDKKQIALVGTCSSYNKTDNTYKELFSTAINHIYIPEPFTGDIIYDKKMILDSLRKGNIVIGIDGLADTTGFRFLAEGDNQSDIGLPGDTVFLKNSITFKIASPENCVCRIYRDGTILREWDNMRNVPYTIYEPGNYHIECSLFRNNRVCDWIITNPIYVVRG